MFLRLRVVNVSITVLVHRHIASVAKYNLVCFFIIIIAADQTLIIIVVLDDLARCLKMERDTWQTHLHNIVEICLKTSSRWPPYLLVILMNKR